MKKYNFFTRIYIQIAAVFASNPFLQNFFKGTIYQGKGKGICVPGLNCYSCPAAVGACPLGSLQSSLASPQRKSSFYIAGFLVSIGAFFGRTICSFLCPFGFCKSSYTRYLQKK